MSGPPVNVYLVDDDRDLRKAVSKLLESTGYNVRAFASGKAILRVYRHLSPGCIILDMLMPEMSGLELQRRLVLKGCRWPVIMLTGEGASLDLAQAVESGIVAFLEKPVRTAELLGAIMRGHAQLLGRAEVNPDPQLLQRLTRLTPRQREVLGYVAANKLNKQIAAYLGVEETTIKGYRLAVMRKLGASNTTELVLLALRAGLIVPPQPRAPRAR